MPLEGLQLGRYRLLHLIGRGNMGEVYLAEDPRVSRQVAIKVVSSEVAHYPNADVAKEATRLFQREAMSIAQLNHPHILPLFDFGEEVVSGAVLTYMVMPFCQEGSLASWLRKNSESEFLSIEDTAHFINQAADALQHAHDHEIVHQDVKPSNFLILSSRNSSLLDLLLADFGIAKLGIVTSNASQAIRGTPIYMAPEQWEGLPQPATDQYALAIMAYQFLAGNPPFRGGPAQLMYQHLHLQPQPPSTFNSHISSDVDTLLLHALAKRPENRFATISTFASTFLQAVQSMDVATTSIASTISKTKGNDIRATLAISKAEALSGSYRTLTLPGGQRVTVSIPSGIQDGQVIRLEGLGEPASSGRSAGSLILTIVTTSKDEVSSISTGRDKTNNVESSTVISNLPGVTVNAAPPTFINTDSRLSSNNYSSAMHQSDKTASDSDERRRYSKGSALLLITLIFLLLAGSAGLFFYTRGNNLKAATGVSSTSTAVTNANGTTITQNTVSGTPIHANSNTTATANAQANSNATTSAITQAQSDATATAIAQANSNSTATAIAQANSDATAQAIANATATALAQSNATATATVQAATQYTGNWVNDDPNTRGDTRLVISNAGLILTVHGYGACSPTDCDWGTRSGTYSGAPFVILFDFGGGLTHQLSMTLTTSDAMHLQVVDVGSRSGTNTYFFHKV